MIDHEQAARQTRKPGSLNYQKQLQQLAWEHSSKIDPRPCQWSSKEANSRNTLRQSEWPSQESLLSAGNIHYPIKTEWGSADAQNYEKKQCNQRVQKLDQHQIPSDHCLHKLFPEATPDREVQPFQLMICQHLGHLNSDLQLFFSVSIQNIGLPALSLRANRLMQRTNLNANAIALEAFLCIKRTLSKTFHKN